MTGCRSKILVGIGLGYVDEGIKKGDLSGMRETMREDKGEEEEEEEDEEEKQ